MYNEVTQAFPTYPPKTSNVNPVQRPMCDAPKVRGDIETELQELKQKGEIINKLVMELKSTFSPILRPESTDVLVKETAAEYPMSPLGGDLYNINKCLNHALDIMRDILSRSQL